MVRENRVSDRRRNESAFELITTAEEDADIIDNGMVIGVSG